MRIRECLMRGFACGECENIGFGDYKFLGIWANKEKARATAFFVAKKPC